MGFKIGQYNKVMIADLKDTTPNKAGEAELKKADVNHDGMIDAAEASRFVGSKTGFAARNVDDAFNLLGGRQHNIRARHQEEWDVLHMYAGNWKGDFNVPGLGAGNVRTDKAKPYNAPECFNVLVDCNLMSRNFLEDNVVSATLVVAPRGFINEPGSDLAEAVAIPLDVATRGSYTSFNRGGGGTSVPEQKYLAASLDPKGLKELAGNSGGISFYIQLETKDGQKHYINKDGKSGSNFEVDQSEFQTQ